MNDGQMEGAWEWGASWEGVWFRSGRVLGCGSSPGVAQEDTKYRDLGLGNKDKDVSIISCPRHREE